MKTLVVVWAIALSVSAFAAEKTEEGFDPQLVLEDCKQAVMTGDAPEAFFEYCGDLELQLREDAKANEEALKASDESNGIFRRLIRRTYWNSRCSYGYGHAGYGYYGHGYSYAPYAKTYYGHYASHGGYGHYGWGHHGYTHYGYCGYGYRGHYHYGHASYGGYGPYRPW